MIPEPQKEYVITEEILNEIGRYAPGIAVKIRIIAISRPYNEQAIREKVKFNSEDLILLAHDEWKRREERKHIFDETTWAAGFLSGFCTSRKWAREYVDKLRQQGERKE